CDFFFFSSRRRHTRFKCDWSSDVCSSDLDDDGARGGVGELRPVEALVLARHDREEALRRDEPSGAAPRRGEQRLRAEEAAELFEIGRASCRERVKMSVDGGSVKKR